MKNKMKYLVSISILLIVALSAYLLFGRSNALKNGSYYYSNDNYLIIENKNITCIVDSEKIFNTIHT